MSNLKLSKFGLSKLGMGVASLGILGLGAGVMASVVSSSLSSEIAGASTTAVNASVPMTCDFGIAGNGYTTTANVTGTATNPIVPGGTVAVDATAAIAMPATLVSDLSTDLGAVSVTINSINVGVEASGDVVQSSQTAAVETINGSALPVTLPVANLTSSIPGVLAETDWTGGSTPGTISFTAGDTVFGVTINLSTGTIPNQGGTCVPDSSVSLGTVTVAVPVTIPPTTATPTTATPTTATPTTATPTTATTTSTTQGSTNPLPIGSVGGVLLALIAGSGLFMWQWRRQRRAHLTD